MEIREITSRNDWESFISKQHETSFLQSWEWGEYEKKKGSDFRRFGIYDQNVLQGLLPLNLVRAKRGSYLYVRRGPIIDWTDVAVAAKTLTFLRQYAGRNGAWFIRISPLLPQISENLQVLKDLGFLIATSHKIDGQLTSILDLTLTEQELYENLRKSTRYDIRKAQRAKVKIIHTDEIDSFEHFEKLYRDATIRNKWSGQALRDIKLEFEIFSKLGMARLFLAEYKKSFISASIFLFYRQQSYYLHSGSSTKYRSMPESSLLQWEAIKYAKQLGMVKHNLWGVSPEEKTTHPWYNLSLFKRGFRGTEVEYIPEHDYILSPFAYATRIFEFIERKLRGYE